MSTCPFDRFTEVQRQAAIDTVVGLYQEDSKSLQEISAELQFGEREILWCLKQRGIVPT